MDIRAALDEVIKAYGHYIIYVRRDLKFRCECYSHKNGEANAKCKKCLGTGYAVAFERIKVRSVVAASPSSEVLVPAGTKVTPTTIYYVPERYHPKDGDLILEVEWDESLVKRIRKKHFISVADPKLGLEGRIEFYQVHCKFEEGRESDDKTIASSSISSDASEL